MSRLYFFWLLIVGLSTPTIPGNRALKLSVEPLFIENLIDNILYIPSLVKCSLLLSKLTARENKIKSACFWVIRGYFIKCGIITLIKSFIDWTE